MLLDKVRKVIKNPRLINQKIQTIFFRNQSITQSKIFQKTFTLKEQIEVLNKNSFFNLLFVGDNQYFSLIKKSLINKKIVWASSNFKDIQLGAQLLSKLNLNDYDDILLCSKNLNDDYRFILNNLNLSKRIPNILWAEGKFEFCGGSIPVSKYCEEAEIIIYNHFPVYFGVFDSLYVKVNIFNSKFFKTFNLILKPNETKQIKLTNFIKNIDETTCVSHECFHPRLCNSRHNRWRSTGVFYWKGSRAMVHSDHDFLEKNKSNEFKISLGLIENGFLNITLPNYKNNLNKENSEFKILQKNKINSAKRSISKNIEEIFLKKNQSSDKNEKGFFGVKYNGFGGSFWFGFDDPVKKIKNASVMANHTSRSFLDNNDAKYKEFNNEFKLFIKCLIKQNIMITPFCLPINLEDKYLEFGFEFDSNSPPLTNFTYRIYSKMGKFIKKGNFKKNNFGPIYTSDLIKLLKISRKKDLGSIFISPDWIKHSLNAIGKGPVGQLIIRNKNTKDKDVTEFQSCWRNNQIIINDFPHWLFPSKMIIGGSKLYCGFSGLIKHNEIFLSLLNGSGNLNYTKIASANIILINDKGKRIEKELKINPFVCSIINLKKHIPNLNKHFVSGFGTILVVSKNCDLNGNLFTSSKGSVTLQHMWGY